MSNPQPNSGTRLFISSTLPFEQSANGFNLINFTQVRGVRLLGDLIRQHQTRERNIIDDPLVKIVRTGKLISPVFLLDIYRLKDDAGQAIFRQTFDSINAYSYKIIRPDNTGFCFIAKTNKDTDGLGDSSSMQSKIYEISLEAKPVYF